jgi:hypothetical protein
MAAAIAVAALGKQAEGLPIGNGRDVASSSIPTLTTLPSAAISISPGFASPTNSSDATTAITSIPGVTSGKEPLVNPMDDRNNNENLLTGSPISNGNWDNWNAVTGLGTGVINGDYNTVYPGEKLYVNSDNMKAAGKPLADITNTQYRNPPWLKNSPLTAAELQEDREKREESIRKQKERSLARERTQERTQGKINEFVRAVGNMLLPGSDHAAQHGNSARPPGKANIGPEHGL